MPNEIQITMVSNRKIKVILNGKVSINNKDNVSDLSFSWRSRVI